MSTVDLDQLAVQLATRLGWSEEAAYLGLRAGFRCEYCDRPLLRSVEDYDSWQNDHVLPKSRGNPDDYRTNKALTCKTCNFFKRHSCLDEPVDGKSRGELIACYRELVRERRAKKEDELAQVRAVLEELGISDGRG